MMNISLRSDVVLAVLAGAWFGLAAGSTCSAQVVVPHYGYHPYYGYVRPGYGYGYGGYGYGGGMTAAMGEGIGIGAAAQGMGRYMQGLGQYQMENAQAQIYYQQAAQEYLKTQGLQHRAYVARQQEQQQEYDAKVAAAREHVEAYKRDMSQRAAPHRLTEDQFDRAHNVIHWPLVLRDGAYDGTRYELDKLFHERTAEDSGADSNNYAAVHKAVKEMLSQVGANIENLDIDQFITAQHFLNSLDYEARFKVGS